MIEGRNEMCEDATGDYYDCIDGLPGGKRGGRDRWRCFGGHGLQAALVMAEARAYLRAHLRTATSVAEAMRRVNDALVPDLSGGRFITLFCAVVDPSTGGVEWTNAGHNPPLVRRADGTMEELAATDPLVGVLEGHAYGSGEPFTLGPGDSLLLYTDGITEARQNGDGELFEIDRLKTAFDADEPDAVDRVARIRDAVGAWSGGARLDDDLTLVVVTRN